MGPPYYDVTGGLNGDGDGYVTAQDVLAVINYINSHPLGSSEGEASPNATDGGSGSPATTLAVASVTVMLSSDLSLTPLPTSSDYAANYVWLPGASSSVVTATVGGSGSISVGNLLTAPMGNDRNPSMSRRSGPSPAGTAHRAWTDSILNAVDGQSAVIEDVLPDLAEDVAKAWHS